MEHNIETLLSFVTPIDSCSRLIVGVDGLSRSGKTTMVKKLAMRLDEQQIPYCVFHMDDHIVERAKRYQTGQEEWLEHYEKQWDIDWFTHHFFERLLEADELKMPFYNAESDTHHVKKVQLPDHGVIIIEGVFLQRQEWRTFFDKVVYLDCPRHTRFLRESEQTQKNIEKFTNRYWKAEDHYLVTERPIEQADLVWKLIE